MQGLRFAIYLDIHEQDVSRSEIVFRDRVQEGALVSEWPLHVVIIGGGLGGSCLAQGLKQAGISVALYEKEQTRGDGFFGFRLAIGSAGSRAMRDVLPPDLYQTFVATCADDPRYLTFYSERLDPLLSTVLPATAENDYDSAARTRLASPMTLRQLLLTGIEDVVHFGKTFTHYERRLDGRVAAFFADGTSVVGDVLVGADGARSQVRSQFLPQAGLRDSGFVVAYGRATVEDAAALLPERRMLDGISVIRGRAGSSVRIHPMTFKWDCTGELKGHVDSFDAALIKTWSGMVYDDTTDHVMWGFINSSRRFNARRDQVCGAELLEEIVEATVRWDPAVRELIKRTAPATVAAARAVASRQVGPWETTNVTLLGGAIHARIPDSGVAATSALQSAGLLCDLIAEAAADRRPIVDAIGEYEAELHGSGFGEIRDYLRCLNRKARMGRPIIGPVLAAGSRTGLRVADRIPGLKKRVVGQVSWAQAGG